MRIALVYDYLNQYGGGERVLELFANIFQNADIYTLFFDSSIPYSFSPARIKKVSFLNKKIIRNHHRLFIPFMPNAAGSLDLKDYYDLIISITAGYAKGVKYKNTKHISYLFTPIRYAWYPDKHLSLTTRTISRPLLSYLRHWDYKTAQKPDSLLTISSYIKQEIKDKFKRDSTIIHPPIDTNLFFPEKKNYKNYYLAVGRLVPYKKFDLLIETFNQIKEPLLIVGRGPHFKKLKKLNTSSNTSFITDLLSDNSLRHIYSNAKALLFPQTEDFGLVALEAIACGTPVIGYQAGGLTDIIQNKKNGLFFKNQTVGSLINALKDFSQREWDPRLISQSAANFSVTKFQANLKKIIPQISAG